MRVYVELFLLDNTLMNFLVLLLASAFSGLRLRPWWAAIGLSFLGGIYALMALILWPFLLHPICKIVFGFILGVGIKAGQWREYARGTFCVFLSAVLLGGLMLGTTLLTGGKLQQGTVIGTVAARAVLWCISLTLLLPRMLRGLRNASRSSGGGIPLEINLGNGKKRYMALLDTGNLMTEPISGLPVVLLHEKKPLPYTATWPVPYHSLAGTGVVNACRPQSARAFIDGKWQQLDVMIATAPGGFSPGIEAILGPNALPAAGPAHRIGKRNISMFLLGRRKQ